LPPLRARRGDIPALAQHFLERFSRQMDSRITQISPEAMELLITRLEKTRNNAEFLTNMNQL